MHLNGIKRIETRGHIRTAHHWSQCYQGRYRKRGPRFAQAMTGRTRLWARAQPHNRPRRRKLP